MNMQLDTANINLSDMLPGLAPHERERGEEICHKADVVSLLFQQITVLAATMSFMRHEQDRKIVHASLVLSAKGSARRFDKALQVINLNLAGLKSPAAIAEAQKIRDSIRWAMDRIQATIPNS